VPHSKNLPCTGESDIHDETFAFGTIDYGRFATPPGQTHWIDDVDLARMRLRLRPAEIVVLSVSDYS
jgi:hypothetical protein